MSDFSKKVEGIDYIKNFYRYKLFDKKDKFYLLTLDDGNFIFLNRSAFLQLNRGTITDQQIYNTLIRKGIILTADNIMQVIKNTKERYSFLDYGPSLHMIMPTGRCNLNCLYCFANSPCSIISENDNEDMSIETAKQVVKFIFQTPSPTIKIEFQGGEPLLSFEIIQVIYNEAIRLNQKFKKRLSFSLVSNFTLMTDKKAKWLVEKDISLCTSLDGPKYVHDLNRFYRSKVGDKIGSYDKVTYWIKRVNEMYINRSSERRVGMLLTVTRYSLPYYKEIIDEYLKFGHNQITIRQMTTLGRAKLNNEDIAYSYQEFYDFYKNCLSYLNKMIKAGFNVSEGMMDLFHKKIIQNEPGFNCDYESPCGAITGNLAYSYDGSIYVCNEAFGRENFRIGNVFEEWNKIMKQKKVGKLILNSMLENNPICDRCIYKPYCGICFIENYENSEKFNYHPKDNRKCYLTKFISERYFKKILKEIKNDLSLLNE